MVERNVISVSRAFRKSNLSQAMNVSKHVFNIIRNGQTRENQYVYSV